MASPERGVNGSPRGRGARATRRWAGRFVSGKVRRMITDALLMPALSSISCGAEMEPLLRCLPTLRGRIVEWPGFGVAAGPGPLGPARMQAHADDVLAETPPGAVGIAAGHGAVFLAASARRHPGRLARLVLIAPTWRGPLPTMFARGRARPGACRAVRRALELPAIGPALYRMNLSAPVIRMMLREHVYATPDAVTPELVRDKRLVAQREGGRFGTAAFVSGALDPVDSRAAFLDLFAAGLPPVLLLRPSGAPARSGAEMDALGRSGHVKVASIPGALGAHEEHPAAVAAAILPFLHD